MLLPAAAVTRRSSSAAAASKIALRAAEQQSSRAAEDSFTSYYSTAEKTPKNGINSRVELNDFLLNQERINCGYPKPSKQTTRQLM